MCFQNAANIAHHAAEKAKREAARITGESEKRVEAMQAQVEALKPKAAPEPPVTKVTPAPTYNPTATIAPSGGLKSSLSKRKTTQNMNKGIAALRIPLNTGGSASSSNVNIG